jgi:hypothetical protein
LDFDFEKKSRICDTFLVKMMCKSLKFIEYETCNSKDLTKQGRQRYQGRQQQQDCQEQQESQQQMGLPQQQ